MEDLHAPPASALLQAELALLGQVSQDLEAVEVALRRIDAGNYGRCEACGEPLGDEMLARSPTAARCAAHDDGAGAE